MRAGHIGRGCDAGAASASGYAEPARCSCPGGTSASEASRRDLGRNLAAARKAAGFTQARLAAVIGYSRSAVANAEVGHADVARAFWRGCDQALGSGGAFTQAFDQLKAAECEQCPRPPCADFPGDGPAGLAWQRTASLDVEEAITGYAELGWPVEAGDGRLELATGEAVDALEVPLAAGLLAVSLWRYSGGRADEVRRLPALPAPDQAMAVIATRDSCFFLTQAGGFPWPGGAGPVPDPAGVVRDGPVRDSGVIRWHGAAGRVPLPPSALSGGGRAGWAHRTPGPPSLVPPAALLGLLAAAPAASGGPGLRLPGGLLVIPAPAESISCQVMSEKLSI